MDDVFADAVRPLTTDQLLGLARACQREAPDLDDPTDSFAALDAITDELASRGVMIGLLKTI